MIDYIIFGEFDINEGNVIRIEYPNKIGISDMILSSYIIPEGTHNIMTDTFCFIINKTNNPEEIILLNSKNKIERLSENSTKYFDLGKNLKKYNIENKIYKVKQIYTFDDNLNDWMSVQNIDKDFDGIKEKTETNISKLAFNNSNGKPGLNSNKTSFSNFSYNPSITIKFYYLIIQKDKNNQNYNIDFYESNQENFIYSSNTPPPILSM